MPRYAKQVDSNQAEIVEYLEKHGCQVIRIGEPLDLLVCAAHRQRWVLLEIKPSLAHSIQRGQLEFLSTVTGPAGVVVSVEEAMNATYYPSYSRNYQQQDALIQWLIRNPDQKKLSVTQFRKIIG